MFSSFDVMVEVNLDEKAEKDFITVGWGKKETQFHGSLGKEGRKKEIEKKSEIKAVLDESIDSTITCCWRGDGEYFVVNYVGENGRMFKVFTKEGICQFCSELCAKLQVPIAWKPSGLWICKPDILPEKYVITLFEKNGLKHNELVLPFSNTDENVVKLSWSQDSDIFLIETKKDGQHCLYFYIINNYHWYLKQTLKFNSKVLTNWNQNYTDSKQLFIFTSKGEFLSLKLDFCIDSSSGRQDEDESIVSVVDGKSLLLTNFRSQVVPPPMSSYKLDLDKSVNLVEFYKGNDQTSNSFIILDHQNNLSIHNCLLKDMINGKKIESIENAGKFEISSSLQFQSILWINKNRLIASSENKILLISLENGKILHEFEMENSVGLLIFKSESEYYAELVNGTIMCLKIENDEIQFPEEITKFPDFCEKVIIVRNEVFFGLKTFAKKLYIGAKEIANEVTSLSITDDESHLLYTTIAQLHFIDLKDAQFNVVDSRKVERGSKIVSLVKNKSQVIFQLPRGNLETIVPRILSLKIVQNLMKSREYKRAFDLMRKERINLNLLVDLNPKQFLDDLKVFVDQINNIQWLNLFITELKKEDVTKTMYKYCQTSDESEEFFENKINTICTMFLELFKGNIKYAQPSITCLVKLSDTDIKYIEQALMMIWELMKSGDSEKATESFNYLLYLVDIATLYNISLGTYDFKLVLFVAQKSQMDPKEYIANLNELNRLQPAYAKFKIDCQLKRYEKAIENIAELCDNNEMFSQCIEVVKKHNLYRKSLEIFKDNIPRYNAMCILFGDYLRIQGKIYEASVMYERGCDYQQSLLCARKILDWRRCIDLIMKLNYSKEEIQDFAMKMIPALKESGRFEEACELFRKFSSDFRSYIELLLEGNFYSKAIFEVVSEGKRELLPEIETSLKNYLIQFKQSLDNDKKSYLENKARLLVVRQEKIVKYQNIANMNDDTFSETSSVQSQSSRQTFRSSKTKRKHEKKLLNLKEGNKFEDIALVDLLWKLVHTIIDDEMQNKIKDILNCAAYMNIMLEGRLLQTTYKELLLQLKNTMNEIWIDEMLTAGKYPDNDEEMMQYYLTGFSTNKLSYELISKFK